MKKSHQAKNLETKMRNQEVEVIVNQEVAVMMILNQKDQMNLVPKVKKKEKRNRRKRRRKSRKKKKMINRIKIKVKN